MPPKTNEDSAARENANMAASLIRCCNDALKIVDRLIFTILGRPFPPGSPCVAVINDSTFIPVPRKKAFDFKEFWEEGILWAVPKSRRTLERRWKRKYGDGKYNVKILSPKQNLLTCNTCGYSHEAGMLCQHCYEKAIAETKEMQTKIQEELGLSPVEQDVVVLYSNERKQKPEEFWQGKRIVEMKKERPPWFAKNLLQRTTQTNAESTDVKPTDLA